MIIKQKEKKKKKKERKTATNFQVVPKLFPYLTFLMLSTFVLLFDIKGFIGTQSVYYLLLNLRLLALSPSVFI